MVGSTGKRHGWAPCPQRRGQRTTVCHQPQLVVCTSPSPDATNGIITLTDLGPNQRNLSGPPAG